MRISLGVFVYFCIREMYKRRLLLYAAFVFLFYLGINKLLSKPTTENLKTQVQKEIKKGKSQLGKRIQSLKRKVQRRKLQIGIVTVFGDFGDLVKGNLEAYAVRYNYTLFIGDDMSFEDQSLVTDNNGLKYQVIQRVLKENTLLDWIFFSAPDSLILNHSVRLERILDDRFHFILPLSPKDGFKDLAQTDHFFVRNTPQGRKIIDDLVHMSTRNCGHFLLEYPASSYAIDGWLHVCENDGNFWSGDIGLLLALYLYREAEYRCCFKRIGERMFSARFPRYAPGDFVLGFREEADLITRRTLLKGALKYADIERGLIDRQRTESLEPNTNVGEGDWTKLEAMYAQLNIPCDQIHNNDQNFQSFSHVTSKQE